MRSETNIDILELMKQASRYWTGAHTKHRMLYHIVWIPKYRKRVLQGEIAKRINELLFECADVNGWHIEELNVQPDHVHMLVQLRPDTSVSEVVNRFKGKSSYLIRKEFSQFKEFFWWKKTDSFWGEGFFVETVGQISEEKIREYIQNQ